MIANDLVNVQPMTGAAGEMLTIKPNSLVEPWKKKFIMLPKKSIYDRIIFGRVNMRGRWISIRESISGGNYETHQMRIVEYATNKELFKAKLEGRDE